jgi:hypothetical protein
MPYESIDLCGFYFWILSKCNYTNQLYDYTSQLYDYTNQLYNLEINSTAILANFTT